MNGTPSIWFYQTKLIRGHPKHLSHPKQQVLSVLFQNPSYTHPPTSPHTHHLGTSPPPTSFTGQTPDKHRKVLTGLSISKVTGSSPRRRKHHNHVKSSSEHRCRAPLQSLGLKRPRTGPRTCVSNKFPGKYGASLGARLGDPRTRSCCGDKPQSHHLLPGSTQRVLSCLQYRSVCSHNESQKRRYDKAHISQILRSEATGHFSLSKANHTATPNSTGAELFSPIGHQTSKARTTGKIPVQTDSSHGLASCTQLFTLPRPPITNSTDDSNKGTVQSQRMCVSPTRPALP